MSSNSQINITASSLDIIVCDDGVVPESQKSLLTQLYFGNGHAPQEKECLSIQTDLELLGANLFAQYWFTDQKVVHNHYKNIHYAHTTEMLFGLIELDCNAQDPIQDITNNAYSEIFQCLNATKQPYLLRTWNFFPEITSPDVYKPNQNRYEAFCHGRLQALQSGDFKITTHPAATVIGNHEDKLQVYFLAADATGTAVENPRQISAYKYPVEDRDTQPLFSRGLIKTWGGITHFYVSGTASIVGHETVHIDDVAAQLNEAINNVETLVAHANDIYQTQLNAQDDLLYMKVYIRHREDLALIQQVLAARLSSTTPRALLLGDMCRENLLVEIEAFYQA